MKRNLTRWLLASTLLAGCITHDDPDPVVHFPKATVTGVVEIDTPIAGATVFIDLDGDNLCDSWEPQTTTDATGHYALTWMNDGPMYASSIGAVVDATSTRAGVVNGAATVGFALHMRAPLAGNTAGDYESSAVISPLTTLIVSEMTNPRTTRQGAEAKLAQALAASHLPFSGAPLDLTGDYASTFTTSTDSAQLRLVAGSVAAIISTAVDKANSVQYVIDCNRAMFFDPSVIAMDEQLTTIANGAFAFSQSSASQRADIEANPANYRNYFVDSAGLTASIEQELIAAALDVAAELFDEIADELVAQLEDACVAIVAEELIGMLLEG